MGNWNLDPEINMGYPYNDEFIEKFRISWASNKRLQIPESLSIWTTNELEYNNGYPYHNYLPESFRISWSNSEELPLPNNLTVWKINEEYNEGYPFHDKILGSFATSWTNNDKIQIPESLTIWKIDENYNEGYPFHGRMPQSFKISFADNDYAQIAKAMTIWKIDEEYNEGYPFHDRLAETVRVSWKSDEELQIPKSLSIWHIDENYNEGYPFHGRFQESFKISDTETINIGNGINSLMIEEEILNIDDEDDINDNIGEGELYYLDGNLTLIPKMYELNNKLLGIKEKMIYTSDKYLKETLYIANKPKEDDEFFDEDEYEEYLEPGIELKADPKIMIQGIYGYKRYNKDNNKIKNIIKRINTLIDKENKLDTTPISIKSWNNNLKDFLNIKFNLRDFYYSENFSFEAIEDFYNNPKIKEVIGNTATNTKIGSFTIKQEFLDLARYINSVGYYNTSKYFSYNKSLNDFDIYKNVLNDNLKESLAYILELIFSGDLPLQALNIHRNFKKLLKKYIAYLIINGDITSSEEINNNVIIYNDHYDLFYNFMVNDDIIFNELVDYCHEMYGYDIKYFSDFIENKLTPEGFKNFIKFVNLVQHSFFTADNLYKYTNLLVFFEIFGSIKKEIYTKNSNIDNEITGLTDIKNKYSNIKIDDFMQIFNKNESIRIELEKYIRESNNRKIYKKLKELWYAQFKANFSTELYDKYDTFKEYLLNSDEELYNYVTNFGSFENDNERRKEIENRILDLSSSIEKFVKSNEGIIYNSTFNVIFSNIKEYAVLLIDAFKAYTLDTINSGNVLDYNDPIEDKIKIFDNDSIEIEDLQFDAIPEYIDIQDDIRKENGDLDFSYNLLVRNLINNTAEFLDNNGNHIDDKYLSYIGIDVFMYESSGENLPYGLTNLTPEEFNNKYGDKVVSSKLGLTEHSYNYVKESYEMYQQYSKEPRNILDYSYITENGNLIRQSQIKVSVDALIEPKNLYINSINITDLGIELPDRDLNDDYYYIDTIAKRIYRSKNDPKLNYTIHKDESPNSKGYYYCDFNEKNNNEYIIPESALTYTKRENDITYIYMYNRNSDTFIKKMSMPKLRNYSYFPSYIIKKGDLEEGKFNIYYDPYLCSGFYIDTIYISPLGNIYDECDDTMTEEKINNFNYDDLYYYSDFVLLTYNRDFFAKYFPDIAEERANFDNRHESKFYMRDYKEYNYVEKTRMSYYNKLILPEIVEIPNIEYINYLNENNLVDGNYLYKNIENNLYYLPSKKNIFNSNYYLNDSNFYEENNLDVRTFNIKGNEIKNIELKLNKEYYITAGYSLHDVDNMYFMMEKDKNINSTENIVNPTITLFIEGDYTTSEKLEELLGNSSHYFKIIGNPMITSYQDNNGTTKAVTGISFNASGNFVSLNETNDMSSTLNLFKNIGSFGLQYKKLNENNLNCTDLGYIIDLPFKNRDELVDEMKKYAFFLRELDGDNNERINIYRVRYDINIHDYNLIYVGSSFGLDTAKILYEPLRYYYDKSNREKMIYDSKSNRSRSEILPYAIDIKENEILDPSPYLYPNDKGISNNNEFTLNSETMKQDKDYLLALHKYYTNRQLKDYCISKTSSNRYIGTRLLSFFDEINHDSVDSNGIDLFYYKEDNNYSFTIKDVTNNSNFGDVMPIVTTSFNALTNEAKLFKTPADINNNAYLLTFYNNIEKLNDNSNINISIDNAEFGFIKIANKGIVDPNDIDSYVYFDSLYRMLETLGSQPLWELSNNFNYEEYDDNSTDPNVIYSKERENLYSYDPDYIKNLNEEEKEKEKLRMIAKLINRTTNNFSNKVSEGSVMGNIKTRIKSKENSLKNVGLYELDNCTYNLFRTEDLNDYTYDYEYAKSIDCQEKLYGTRNSDSYYKKLVEFSKLDTILPDNCYQCLISIYDENGNSVIYNEDINNVNNILNDEIRIIGKNKIYTIVLLNVFKGVPSGSGNFIACTNFDSRHSSGIEILKDENQHNKNRLGTYTGDFYYNESVYVTGQEMQVKFTSKNIKMAFKLCGVITFDEFLSYNIQDESDFKWMKINDRNTTNRVESDLYNFYTSDKYKLESVTEFITHEFDSTGIKEICISKNLWNNDSQKIGDYTFVNNIEFETKYNLIANFDNQLSVQGIRNNLKYINKTISMDLLPSEENNDTNFNKYKLFTNKYADYEKYFDFGNTSEEEKSKVIPHDSSNTIWVKNEENNEMVFTYGKNIIKVPLYNNKDTKELMRKNEAKFRCKILSNNNLIACVLPSNTRYYGNSCFQYSNIKNINIGCITNRINNSAFEGSKLNSLYFLNNKDGFLCENGYNEKDSLLVISHYAFSHLDKLKNKAFKIKFPYNMYEFGWRAFGNSTFVGLDFTNCYCLNHIGTDCFTSEIGSSYFGRRYVISENNDRISIETIYNQNEKENIPVYEGDPLVYDQFMDENGEFISNNVATYKFSEFEYLELPYGEKYPYFRIYGNAFRNNEYLRRAFLGNSYMLASSVFDSCYRLMYISAKEIRYSGGRHLDDTGLNTHLSYTYKSKYIVKIYENEEDKNNETNYNLVYSYNILNIEENEDKLKDGIFFYNGKQVNYLNEEGKKTADNNNYHIFYINNTKYYYTYEDNIESGDKIYYLNNRNYRSSLLNGTNSIINTYAHCYSLLDVVFDKLKTIQSNSFTDSGLYSLFRINNELKFGYFKENEFVELLGAKDIDIESEYSTPFGEKLNNLYVFKMDYAIHDNKEDKITNIMCCDSHKNINNYEIVDYLKTTYLHPYSEWEKVRKKQEWNSVYTTNKFSKDNAVYVEIPKWSPTNYQEQLAKLSNSNSYFIRQVEPKEIHIKDIESYNNNNQLEVYNLKDIYFDNYAPDETSNQIKQMIQNTLNSNEIEGYFKQGEENRLFDYLQSVVLLKGKDGTTYEYSNSTNSVDDFRKNVYKVNYEIKNDYHNRSLFIEPFYINELNTFKNCNYNNYYMDQDIYEFDLNDIFNIANNNSGIYSNIFKYSIYRSESVKHDKVANNNWTETSNNGNNKFIRENMYNPNEWDDYTNYEMFASDSRPNNFLDLTINDGENGNPKKRIWITNTMINYTNNDLWEEKPTELLWNDPDRVFKHNLLESDNEINYAIEEFGHFRDKFVPSTNIVSHANRIIGFRTLESDNTYRNYDGLNNIINIYSITIDSNNNPIEFLVNGTNEQNILEKISITNDNNEIFIDFKNDSINNLTYSDVFNILLSNTTINNNYAETIYSNGIRKFTNKTQNGSNYIFS